MHSISILPSERPKTPYKTVESHIQWFLLEYLFDYTVDVTVVYMDLSDEGVDGWCMREDDNEFLIQIDENLEGEEHEKTLFHELYHLYQHMSNIPRCEICAHLSEEQSLDKFKKSL